MFGNDHAQPAAQRLAQLHSTGQWERLIDSARQSLAAEPSNVRAHRHLAWGYAKTDRFSEMQPEVEYLLREQPEEPENHQLAAIHFLETGKHGTAKRHIAYLLRARPQNSNFHFLAALLALRMGRLNAARIHIRKTRELAPRWADAAHLEIEIDSRDEREVRNARERIRRLEETMLLDPGNAQVAAKIGAIYLEELEEPRPAEEFYRRSLAMDARQRAVQFSLLLTIFARSLLYRTLMFPVNLLRSFSPKDDFLVSSILLAWGSVAGLYFTPAAWLFERMVLQEFSVARSPWRKPFYFMRRWPIWLRLWLSYTAVTGVLFVLLWKVAGLQMLAVAQILGGTFGVHFAFVAGFAGQTKIRAALARRKRGPVESIKSSAFVLDRDHTCASA